MRLFCLVWPLYFIFVALFFPLKLSCLRFDLFELIFLNCNLSSTLIYPNGAIVIFGHGVNFVGSKEIGFGKAKNKSVLTLVALSHGQDDISFHNTLLPRMCPTDDARILMKWIYSRLIEVALRIQVQNISC